MIELPALNIQLRIQAPYDVVLTTGLPAGEMSLETVGHVMDLLTNVVEREHLKLKLKNLRETQKQNREDLARKKFDRELVTLKEQIDLELEVLRDARNAFDQEISASWVNSARRGERKLNERQEKDMAKYDTQITDKQKELNEKIRLNRKLKRDIELGLPMTDWQIDCLYAQIAGQAEPPMPEEVARNLELLEMPEDVGFPPQLVA